MAALVAALFVLGAFVPAATAQDTDRAQLRQGCSHAYTLPYYKVIARKLINNNRALSKWKLYRLAAMRYCAKTDQGQRRMLLYTRHILGERRAYFEYLALTPFIGPDGRRWAIPWAIVNCESGGSWSAHNPRSPARGAYQLLGHGEPWPANTTAARLAHHRIARNLYLSSGTRPWTASQHCWG